MYENAAVFVDVGFSGLEDDDPSLSRERHMWSIFLEISSSFCSLEEESGLQVDR